MQADEDDAEEILALQKLAYQSEAVLYNDWKIPPLCQSLAEIVLEFDKRIFLKVMNDGAIIASVRASLDGVTCLIGRLIVHPEFQKKGIGTLLMKKIESFFPKAHRFKLFTGAKSTGNIRFYHKLGYRVSRNEVLSQKVTIVFMEKEL